MANKDRPASPQGEAGMRLDKFLKVSRIIKRRSVANDACDTDHVSVNGRPAKPGLRLKVGDVITLRFGESANDFEVLSLNEHARKDEAGEMYRMLK